MNKLTPELAELIGIIIGDGFISKYNNSYRIGIVGSPKTDNEYFEIVKKLIKKVWNKDIKIIHRERGLRITFGSKDIFEYLVYNIKIPYGIGKCEKVIIPLVISKNWNLVKHTIRGIVDTDGSVFSTNKPRCSNYPSIEISTSSYKLALQLKLILEKRNFRVTKIWGYKSKLSRVINYKIGLNGKDNLIKWLDEISFSNPYKYQRALKIVKKNGAGRI